MSTIDETGFDPSTYAEILAGYVADLQAAYGDNVRTDAQAGFGQLIRLFGLTASELNDIAQFILQSFNPNTSVGAQLSSLMLTVGIQRNESAYSTVTLTVGANAVGSTIPAGSIVSDASVGISWATDAEVVVSASSTNTVSATATVIGANLAAAGTITQIDTDVYGWTTVTNLAAANAGQTEETDAAARLRFASTVDSASTVSDGARFQAVSDLTGVESVHASSNNTGSTNGFGVPTATTWTVVDGGVDAAIAEAIYNHTAAGIGWHGSTTVVHEDKSSGDNYSVKFDRPTDLGTYISVTLVTDSDFPIDGAEQVETAILTYIGLLQLGQDVLISRLYTPINTIPGHYVSTLYIGFSATPTGVANLSVDPDERAVTDTAKIVIVS